jgi:hypothetical protein
MQAVLLGNTFRVVMIPGKGISAKRKVDFQETRSGCLKQPAAKPHQEARYFR